MGDPQEDSASALPGVNLEPRWSLPSPAPWGFTSFSANRNRNSKAGPALGSRRVGKTKRSHPCSASLPMLRCRSDLVRQVSMSGKSAALLGRHPPFSWKRTHLCLALSAFASLLRRFQPAVRGSPLDLARTVRSGGRGSIDKLRPRYRGGLGTSPLTDQFRSVSRPLESCPTSLAILRRTRRSGSTLCGA
jgi:hypothetical protein